MKKTLIATAVAAAAALPLTAQADMVLYGQVHNTIMNVDASTGGNATAEQWQVQDDSLLGFKGSENLGDGMQAIWKYEQAYDTDGTSAGCPGTDETNTTNTASDRNCNARNTYVGLAGDFGTFLIGRVDTPYKTAWYAGDADFGDGTIADMNATGFGGDNVGDDHFDETRASNAIAYMSPDLSGFRVAMAVIPGETTGVEDSLTDSWSGGLMYAANGLKIGAGLESLADTTANTPNEKRWHITGSYNYDNFTLGASYANVEDDNYVDGDKKKTFGLSVKYALGRNAIGANYRFSDLENAANGNGDIQSWAVYAMHNLSKRTSIYVAYGQSEYDREIGNVSDQETNEYGIGIIHKF